ncbi:fatty acid-binding protein 10-A, liver basic-like [Ptychodera flava]|uniref:fatty acid-binding protein 10-A, liver basic-like n=1 Tax=Ptychodera flava TaxID=63121 RepID=UPI00396A8C41
MALLGEWVHYKDDNFGAFLDVIGAPEENKKLASSIHPTVVFIKNDDDTYTMQVKGPKETMESTFELDKEFSHMAGVGSLSGRRRRAIAKKLGEGKFEIRGLSADTAIDRVIETREVVDGDMVVTIEADGITAKRYFKRP